MSVETHPSRAATRLGRVRRWWPYAAAVLAVLLWWPVGFAGRAPWLHLPLRAEDADVLGLGALCAAAVVSALVRQPWVRLLVVAALAGLGWLLGPVAERADAERGLVGLVLVAGCVLGLVLGVRASRRLGSLTTVLAVIAAWSPGRWPHVLVLATALALPFWRATKDTVAPPVLGVVKVVTVYVAARVVGTVLAYGWDGVGPARGIQTRDQVVDRVRGPMADLLRTSWRRIVEGALADVRGALLLAAVLAVLIVVGRQLYRVIRLRRASPENVPPARLHLPG